MVRYITLINWTEQGIKNFKQSGERADQAGALAEKMGGKMTGIWWTVGPYDLVATAEFPDDATGTAYLLQLGSLGNVRTTTLRAWDRSEFAGIVDKTG